VVPLESLCLLFSVASLQPEAVGIMGVARFDITHPFLLAMYVYMIMFGCIAFLLEMDTDKMQMPVIKNISPHVENYHVKVFEYAKFLTALRGRGAFYIFVGTLAITRCTFCLLFIVGCVNGFVGVMCLLMSYGVQPDLPSALDSARRNANAY